MQLLNKLLKPIRLRSKDLSRVGIQATIKKSFLKLEAESKILVIGGFGPVLAEIFELNSSLGYEIFTLDIEPKHNPNFLLDICGNDVSSMLRRQFDLVIAIEVLEHTENPQAAINNIYDVLNPKGTFILSTPWITPIHDEPNDYYRFSQFGLSFLLKKFTEVVIFSRGNYRDSLLMLGLRGLKVQGASAKCIAIAAYIASYLNPKPKIYNTFNRSCIGYIVECKK